MKRFKCLAVASSFIVGSATAQDFTAIDALEGVWVPHMGQDYPYEACHDSESPYRVAIGRFKYDQEAGVLRFGPDQSDIRHIGFYEAGCELGAPIVNSKSLASAANCKAEGEDYQGIATFRIADPFTISVSTPVNNGEMAMSSCKVDHSLITWRQPPAKIFYGTRAGMTMTVRGAYALDSEVAIIYLEHTKDDAMAFCVEYLLDMEPDCFDRTLEENKTLERRIQANCVTGEFNTPYGQSWVFRGPTGSKDELEPEFSLYDVQNKIVANGSMSSGYYEALGVMQALCPAQFDAP